MRWAIYHGGATPLTHHYCTGAVHALRWVMFYFTGMAVVCSQPRIQHTYYSPSHLSERWHRGCLETIEANDLGVFPHRYRRDDTHRRHRTGGAWKRYGNILINVIAPGVILPLITVIPSKLLPVVYPSAANSTQTVGRLIAHIFCGEVQGRSSSNRRLAWSSFFSARVLWTATFRFHHCSTTTVYRWGYHKLTI